MTKQVVVCGAGGFIGGHLVNRLVEEGNDVFAVDKKPFRDWMQINREAESVRLDLSVAGSAKEAAYGADEIYMLAADMGGMGFIEHHKLDCMLSVLTSTHMLQAAHYANVGRFFYSSSACVYAADKQRDPNVTALKEEDAYPAEAEDGYGWEKLFTERMCRHFREEAGLETRIARYHNVYGPWGTFDGGREKAPAAICRKVALAKINGFDTIEIWGDGEQTRSFMYISDCVEGTLRIARGDFADPVNLGSSELVSINQLVSVVEEIAGVSLKRQYNLSAPQGVRGRNSDNSLISSVYGWEPSVSLREGMEETFKWIYDELVRR